MGAHEFNAGGNPAMDYHPFQGGVEILLVASRYRNRDKVRPDSARRLMVSTFVEKKKKTVEKLVTFYGQPCHPQLRIRFIYLFIYLFILLF